MKSPESIEEILQEGLPKKMEFGVYLRPKTHPEGPGIILVLFRREAREYWGVEAWKILRNVAPGGEPGRLFDIDLKSPVSLVLDWLDTQHKTWCSKILKVRFPGKPGGPTRVDIIAARGADTATALLRLVAPDSMGEFVWIGQHKEDEFHLWPESGYLDHNPFDASF